jgi:uncharacterized protein YndB with AHSA1/START domain
MKKLEFSLDIRAPREKIWKILWEDATYRQWTSVFSEGSYAKTDWKEGSKVLFLGPDGGGMHSTIARHVPNAVMAFRHEGELKNGQEQPPGEGAESWMGAMETYTLQEMGNSSRLSVEMDTTEGHEDYFQKTFPQALQKVKELAEK